MTIYLETIKEIKELASQSVIRDKRDVAQYLNRCSAFVLMAEGVYGRVYHLPDEPDKVVKVCTDKPDGYYIFARWCMAPENRGNPHLPVIYCEDVIAVSDASVIHCYVIERLAEVTDDGARAVEPRHFHHYGFGILWVACKAVMQSFGTDHRHFPQEIQTLESFVERIRAASVHLSAKTDNGITDTVDDDVINAYGSFLTTLFAVLTHLSPIGVMDLHGSNFMLRDDMVVITDPIAHKYTN